MNDLFPMYEVLSKLIAYVDDRPEFQAQVQQFLSANGYRIDRTFDNQTTGFHAIALVPTQPGKPPVLVFRGADGINDDPTLVDSRGIGRSQIEGNQVDLRDWLTQAGQTYAVSPDLLGHSLGGALAQNAAATFTSLIGNTVTFNSPGVARAIAEQFLANGGANKIVNHFIVSGDLVSLAGGVFLPGKAILQSFSDGSLNPLVVVAIDPVAGTDKHTRRDLLTNPPVGYSQREISTTELSSPNFNFNSDPDFAIFQAAVAKALPQFASLLASRGNIELIRSANNASFLGLVTQLSSLLSPDRANFLQGDERDNTAIALGENDTILGAGGNDTLFGNQGNDSIDGGNGSDRLFGGQGNDTLLGGNGDDLLFGNLGDDLLNGNDGNDQLFGGQGSDILLGGSGNDSLNGDLGNDVLTGGTGSDYFILAVSRGMDTITDFTSGEDILVLPSGISFAQLRIETATTGSNSVTIINLASSNEAIATLSGVVSLSANNFIAS
jgi:serralysin